MVTEGLRLLLAREADRGVRLAELDAAIAMGMAQADGGDLRDGAGSRARVEAALAARGA
jgi:Arc/MetJ-type ribon-helix-helix transcriptional regulator